MGTLYYITTFCKFLIISKLNIVLGWTQNEVIYLYFPLFTFR